ncbi:YpfB family protein [Cytobacillus sp. NCCP-133]|uniref:YpfB family protein n=1 Tax=Cytobacillus sp. NCCP-133 TaxID=766848 RepID=UPI003FA4B674
MMKAVERIILKLIIVQFIFLLFTQLFFHHLNAFPELKQLTQYEGVTDQNFTELLETFSENY